MLSDTEFARFSYDYPSLEIAERFSRTDFNKSAGDVKEKIFAALDDCLKQASITREQVDLVCMTGGSAKVPLIREGLEHRFGRAKLATQSHFHSVLSGLIESAGNLIDQ